VKAVQPDAAGGRFKRAQDWASLVVSLQILRFQSSVFRNPREHLGTKLIAIMK
jgi:hypothetical protein